MAVDLYDISALVSSRICHDLISPLGAIGNGVDLLTMEDAVTPELAMIGESVSHANARLRFFRIAYGSTTTAQRVARNEVLAILQDISLHRRLKLEWASDGELARHEVKLAFLLLQCLESAMPYGGNIRISQAGLAWQAVAEAKRLLWDEHLWQLLEPSGPKTAGLISPQHVQFLLVPPEMQRQSRSLNLEREAQGLSLAW